jgi:hypothetical protein
MSDAGDGDGDDTDVLFDIVGPNTLPDDIFSLGIDTHEIAPSTLTFASKTRVRNRDGATQEDGDFEEKTIRYDLDCVDHEYRDLKLSPDEFKDLLIDLDNIFITPFKEKSDTDLIDYIYKLWDLEDVRKDGIVEMNDIKRGYEKNLSQVLKIYMLFFRHKMVGTNGSDTIWNQNFFCRVLKIIYYMEQRLVAEYQIRQTLDEDCMMNQENTDDILRFTPQDTSRLTPFQRLLLFLFHKAHVSGYRLYREEIYKQIYCEGHPTHAWKRLMPTLAFVYHSVDRDVNFEMWCHLTHSRSNPKDAATNLMESKDRCLPTLEPDRHLFAFTDGLYDAKCGRFHPYDIDPLPSDRVAVKFFQLKFNPQEMARYGADWYNIPTEALQSILDYQGLSADVCKVIYAMMGRCLYNLGELDRWEVIMFIKGVAGSGKSTIGKILQEFYPSTDVSILSSNIEKQFGLGAIYDKLLFLCLEVKATWNLNQGDFQCMISGEEIQIPVKHKTAFTDKWNVPGVLMGNEVAHAWLDAAGSMTRRILVVEFNKRVKHTNTSLGSQLKEILPAILHKCNLAYHEMVRNTGRAGLWDTLPEYFKDTRKNLSATINPLEDFLTNCDSIQLNAGDPNCCIPYEEFQIMYFNFLRRNNYSGGKDGTLRFNKDVYATTFEINGISVRTEAEKEYKGMTKHGVKWIFGVGLKDEDSMLNDA